MKRVRNESGQAVILLVVCMTCLLGFVALAGDVGILFRAKRIMQTAADAGAIAGALEVNYGDWAAAAKAAAQQNGVTDTSLGGTATVTVNNPPQNGPHKSATPNGYVEVIVSQPQPSLFMKVFNTGSMTVNARSVAYLNPAQFCVYTLSTTNAGIASNGLAEWMALPNCGLVDNADAENNGFYFEIDASYVGLVGGNKGVNIPSGFKTINPVSDPFGYLTPPSIAGCGAAKNISGNSTLSPGCYDGLTITGGANVTFSPGLFRFNGPVSFNGAGTLTGSGVTFYFNNTFTFNSLSLTNLSAPTDPTNPWNGILLFQSRTPNCGAAPCTSPPVVAINGLNLSVLQGIIYMPKAILDLSGVNGMILYDPLVVGQIQYNNLIGFTANFQNYNSVNSNSPLTQATLAE